VDEGDGGQAAAADGLEHGQRQATHRPPRDDVRAVLGEVAVEHRVVVAGHGDRLARAQLRELAADEMPAQLAMDVRIVRLGRAGPRVGGQDPHLVASPAQVLDGRPPDELVAAEAVRRVHVAGGQDAQGGEDRVPPALPSAVDVSVVVPSHARPLRLLWLLNALEEQTYAGSWEVVVVHDYDAPTAARILDEHPLHAAGRLRHEAVAPGTGSPARQRNLGWRSARGALVAFTDDDCRPAPDWLERLVAAARRAPGGVVQGATRPDPLEHHVLAAPHVRTLAIEPVGPFAQTCNILYPRALLERLGGFDERAISGEDVGLSMRARAAGAAITGAPDAVVHHAIESHTLPGILRQNLKWRHLAYLVRRHPQVRRDLTLGVFWDDDHLWMTVAVVGLAGAPRRRALAALALPYVVRASRRRGSGPRARAIALAELPGQAVRQLGEVAGLAAGSVRHRTALL
jgi:glycosyltransferase involved in cell wall biosynthesis